MRHWSRDVYRLDEILPCDDCSKSDRAAMVREWARRVSEPIPAKNKIPFTFSLEDGDQSEGRLSLAGITCNPFLDVCGQIETSPGGYFFGLYDGHHLVADFLLNHLCQQLMIHALDEGGLLENTLKDAFEQTKVAFRSSSSDTHRAAVEGICCLAGSIWKGTLHVLNSGGSEGALITYVDDMTSDGPMLKVIKIDRIKRTMAAEAETHTFELSQDPHHKTILVVATVEFCELVSLDDAIKFLCVPGLEGIAEQLVELARETALQRWEEAYRCDGVRKQHTPSRELIIPTMAVAVIFIVGQGNESLCSSSSSASRKTKSMRLFRGDDSVSQFLL